jgi:hypothetical protein
MVDLSNGFGEAAPDSAHLNRRSVKFHFVWHLQLIGQNSHVPFSRRYDRRSTASLATAFLQSATHRYFSLPPIRNNLFHHQVFLPGVRIASSSGRPTADLSFFGPDFQAKIGRRVWLDG